MTSKKDVEDGKMFAFLGVFLSLLGFIIVLLAKRDNSYAMFYAKQGLALFIAYVIAAIGGMIFGFIPFIGWVVSLVLWLGVFVLWIMGIVYSLSGEEKEIPLVGAIARKINL